MKIAISISTPDPRAPFDSHFGRAGGFLLLDAETQQRRVVTNPAAQAGSGAGIRAADFLVRENVGAVISGSFGPKASQVLRAAGVRLYKADPAPVADLIARFNDDELTLAEDA